MLADGCGLFAARNAPGDRCAPPVLEGLEPRLLLSGIDPTPHEQLMLERINRARSDPAAEADRYGIDLNEGVPAENVLSADPRPPLVFSEPLIQAARSHSRWMLETDQFGHQGPGDQDTPGDRMTIAGYRFDPPYRWSENVAWRGQTVLPPDVTTTTVAIHEDLFVDADYPGRGHRLNILDGGMKEVGIGLAEGVFRTEADGGGSTAYHAVMATVDFAASGQGHWLTGVVYDDWLVAGNARYDVGEGLGGVTVVAVDVDSGAEYTTTTWSAGGYRLAVPDGTYDVTALGGPLDGQYTHHGLEVAGANVKADVTPQMIDASTGGRIELRLDGMALTLDPPATVDFGARSLHAPAVSRTVTVHNTGSDPLALGAAVIEQSEAFEVTDQPARSVPPGGASSFTVRLRTDILGDHEATLRLASSDPSANPVTLSLSAEVGGEPVTLRAGLDEITDGQAAPVDFGRVNQDGPPAEHRFTIANETGQLLSVSEVRLIDAQGFEVVEQTTALLAPGASTGFTLRMTTETPGMRSGTVQLVLAGNEADPFTFPVAGEVEPPPPRADLSVTVEQVHLPSPAVPLDRGWVGVRLANEGNALAVGSLELRLRLQRDRAQGPAGEDLFTWTPRRAVLREGAGRTFRLPVRLPTNLPAGEYRVVAELAPGARMGDENPANHRSVGEAKVTVVWQFGQVGDRSNVPLRLLAEARGQWMAIALAGGGRGEVVGAGLDAIHLSDTTPRSTLVVRGPATAGITLGSIFAGEGAIRGIIAPTADLRGDVSAPGGLGLLVARDLIGGDQVIDVGPDTGPGLVVRLGKVDDTSLVSQGRVHAIVAAEWTDSGDPQRIAAPSLRALVVTGAGGSAGDFQADLDIRGDLVAARIVGDVTSESWRIDGAAVRLVVGGSLAGGRWSTGGDLRVLVVGAMVDANVLVGVGRQMQAGHISSSADLLNPAARLGVLVVRGRRRAGELAFDRSYVSAGGVGRTVLLGMELSASPDGKPWGLFAVESLGVVVVGGPQRLVWDGRSDEDGRHEVGPLVFTRV